MNANLQAHRAAFENLTQAGVPASFMPRLVRVIRELDRATAASMELPGWRVFVIANGASSSVVRHAKTSAEAVRDAKAEGYRVTGLAVPVK